MGQSARAAVAILMAWATPAAAQLPALGVPRGTIRAELSGSLASATGRFNDGTREDVLGDFASEALGSGRFPELAGAESRFSALLGTPYRFDLGALRPHGYVGAGTIRVGASVGVTRRLTVFANMPFTRTKVHLSGPLDPSGATAGVNLAHPLYGTPAGQQQTAAFLGEFTTALATLDARIQAGDYDAEPAVRALAEQALADGTAFRDGLTAVLTDPATAAPFAPLDGSTAGTVITGTITGLQVILANDLGVTGFSSQPALPVAGLTLGELEAYTSHPAGEIRAAPITIASTAFLQGDAEIGAVFTILDAWDAAQRAGGHRLAIRGTVRLPTAGNVSPDDPLALPPGDGQTDVEFDATLDFGRGPAGARASARWTRQLAGTREMRVAPPTVPLPTADLAASLRVDPGDEVALGLRPFLRLAPGLALTARVEYLSRGADTAEYEGDALPGVDASVVTEGSARSALLLGGGVTFAAPTRDARPMGVPADAFLEVTTVASSSKGRVPDMLAVSVGVQFHFRAW